MKPHLWSAEKPYLYTLYWSVAGETYKQAIGLRQLAIDKDGLCNHQAIRLIGVNTEFPGPDTDDSDLGTPSTRLDTHEAP